MEDVLEVYQRPYDGNEVLVCMDETSKQQVKETRVPRPAAPGLSAAYDYEYERNGVSSLFMLFAPLDGWRRGEVRERRTKVDWAHVIKKLVDEDYPDRDRIVLVMDNLNTHKLSSLYEAFEPAEARRIAERLEIHYTLAEQGVDHDAGSVIDGQQQREGRTIVSKPPVVATVHLYQHALAGHPLPADTVPGRPTAARALQAGTRQYAPQRGSTDLYALALPEQLAQVSVVGIGVAGLSKSQHFGPQRLRRCVGRP